MFLLKITGVQENHFRKFCTMFRFTLEVSHLEALEFHKSINIVTAKVIDILTVQVVSKLIGETLRADDISSQTIFVEESKTTIHLFNQKYTVPYKNRNPNFRSQL